MTGTTILITLLASAASLVLGILIGQQQASRRQRDLHEQLRALSAQAVTESSQQVLALADSRVQATEHAVAPVRHSLDKLNERLTSMESQGASWQSQLRQQVESVHLSGVELRQQTQALADALRRPQVRGNWGEMQLRRSLEISGLTSRCAFEEQVSRRTDDGVLRPDVVVRMAGGKSVVVDSKVSLDGFLEANNAREGDARAAALDRHAKQVRRHVDALADKAYWQQFAPAPEFVVMFLPSEAIFAQAMETDPTLIDYAASRQVMLATPTTLIAMLKTVAYAWSQDALADNARDVHQLGRELYERLCTVGNYLDKLGRSMSSAVGSYNAMVGSLESRVLVSARRMRDLEVVDKELDSPATISDTPKPMTAPELVASEHEPSAIEGSPGQEQWTRRVVGE